MNNQENQPVVTQQTLAQNEAVENVLDRFKEAEIYFTRPGDEI